MRALAINRLLYPVIAFQIEYIHPSEVSLLAHQRYSLVEKGFYIDRSPGVTFQHIEDNSITNM